MSRNSKYGDMGVDWDADALMATKAPYPYTSGEFFDYFKDLVRPNDRVLEVGCQIASWIWAWWGIEPTIRYEGLDWSPFAIKIARERYGKDGGQDLSSMKKAWIKWWLLNKHPEISPPAVFYLMDARDMDFNEEFDIVFTHTFFQHTSVETKQIVVPKIWKALKPDGLLIIQENTSYDSKGTWFKEGWIKFFEAHGFKILKIHDIGGGGTGFIFKKSEGSGGIRDTEKNNPPEHQWERYYRLKPGDIYVEAGAYLCRYGKIASKKVGPEGRVILIEPSPQNIAVIKEVVKNLSLTNVTLVEEAVWSERGKGLLRVDGNPSANRLVTSSPAESSTILEVATDTVDGILRDLGLDHVDLFAADVENAEVEMMKGMENCLGEKRIRNLAIAAYHKHPDGNYDEISEMLREKGYRGIKVWGGVVYAHI